MPGIRIPIYKGSSAILDAIIINTDLALTWGFAYFMVYTPKSETEIKIIWHRLRCLFCSATGGASGNP
jgi:hypothetical protein